MGNPTLARVAAWTGWSLIALFALLVAAFSMRLLSFNTDAVPDELRQNALAHPFIFFTHTTIAPLALILGVWQFLPVKRRSAYHRWAGRLYVACVAIASVAGFLASFSTDTGPAAGISFGILAVLWFAATARAYLLARSGDFLRHCLWMIRSYALTCAGISLRIIVPVGIALGGSFRTSYIVAAWGCWIGNVLIGEWIVRKMHFRETSPRRPVRSLRPARAI